MTLAMEEEDGWWSKGDKMDQLILIEAGWNMKMHGFGNLTGEFWYGLRALHCLTSQGGWEMRMDIKLANGTNIFLQYEQFKIASANTSTN